MRRPLWLPAPSLHRAISAAGAVALAASALAISGCASHDVSDYAQEYPQRKPVATTLDVQVVRRATTVTLTNTTPHTFGRCNLWLNQWFVRPIKGLAAGETLELPLHEFVDTHSDSYRGGGFFATRAPDRLVSAHIELEDEVIPLIVAFVRDK